jgi:hypothetical protein
MAGFGARVRVATGVVSGKPRAAARSGSLLALRPQRPLRFSIGGATLLSAARTDKRRYPGPALPVSSSNLEETSVIRIQASGVVAGVGVVMVYLNG